MMEEPDLDAYLERIKAEQQHVVEEEVPQKLAVAFGELFGPGWLMIPRIVARYEEAVAETRAYLSAIAESANGDFEAHRAQGFRSDFKPVRH
jgi:hypothetical protein